MARKGEVNHYAAGLTLIVVGTFGIIGSLTGELANMLAALWAPDALASASGANVGPKWWQGGGPGGIPIPGIPAQGGLPGEPGWLKGLGNAINNFFGPGPFTNLPGIP